MAIVHQPINCASQFPGIAARAASFVVGGAEADVDRAVQVPDKYICDVAEQKSVLHRNFQSATASALRLLATCEFHAALQVLEATAVNVFRFGIDPGAGNVVKLFVLPRAQNLFQLRAPFRRFAQSASLATLNPKPLRKSFFYNPPSPPPQLREFHDCRRHRKLRRGAIACREERARSRGGALRLAGCCCCCCCCCCCFRSCCNFMTKMSSCVTCGR
jgi:hypothetical protein